MAEAVSSPASTLSSLIGGWIYRLVSVRIIHGFWKFCFNPVYESSQAEWYQPSVHCNKSLLPEDYKRHILKGRESQIIFSSPYRTHFETLPLTALPEYLRLKKHIYSLWTSGVLSKMSPTDLKSSTPTFPRRVILVLLRLQCCPVNCKFLFNNICINVLYVYMYLYCVYIWITDVIQSMQVILGTTNKSKSSQSNIVHWIT